MMQTLSVSTPKDRTTALVNLDIMEMESIVKVRIFFRFPSSRERSSIAQSNK